jgi:hypothetical protein
LHGSSIEPDDIRRWRGGSSLEVTTGIVNGAAIAERAFAHAPDALTTDAPTAWRASWASGGLLAALISPSQACR